ncbi:MAG: hypothetical protein HKM04_11945 [Legionellales bacterium]|nr:hypothetical protein [Legionellales bacterium]
MPDNNNDNNEILLNPGILPLKFVAAFSANLALTELLNISLPVDYEAMFSAKNLTEGLLKTLATAATMNIPWSELSTLTTSAAWRKNLPEYIKGTMIGLVPFSLEGMVGNVIRFSLPPTLMIHFILRGINAFNTATILDHFLNKLIPQERFLQLIVILIFKQFSGDIQAALSDIISSSLPEGVLADALQIAAEITANVIIPPAAGFFSSPLFSMGRQAPGAMKKCVDSSVISIKEAYGSFFNKNASQSSSEREEAQQLTPLNPLNMIQ